MAQLDIAEQEKNFYELNIPINACERGAIGNTATRLEPLLPSTHCHVDCSATLKIDWLAHGGRRTCFVHDNEVVTRLKCIKTFQNLSM